MRAGEGRIRSRSAALRMSWFAVPVVAVLIATACGSAEQALDEVNVRERANLSARSDSESEQESLGSGTGGAVDDGVSADRSGPSSAGGHNAGSDSSTSTTAATTTSSTSTTTTTTIAPAPEPEPAIIEVAQPASVPPTTGQWGVYGNVDPPEFPASIDGYHPIGETHREIVRVFQGSSFATAGSFFVQMNSCAEMFWVARWRSLSDDVTIQARLGPFDAEMLRLPYEPWLMPPASTRGYLAGNKCHQPLLYFGASSGPSTLVDVVIEWTYYEVGVSTGPSPPSSPPPPTCSSYRSNGHFPLRLCDESFGIFVLQDALRLLGFDVGIIDGYFGPATYTAVIAFQRSAGLTPDGIVGVETWGELLPQYRVTAQNQHLDLNGDGVIGPYEIPGH